MFRIDVSPEAETRPEATFEQVTIQLLQQLVSTQQQQNKLLESLVQQNAAAQQQRSNELQQWRQANPGLSKDCREAAELLSEVQTRFLANLTEEIRDSGEHLVEGEFMMNEFVDRFGPRMAHLNGILQVLAQLGTGESAAQQQEQ
ncbi:hypothetical protein Pan14r_19740 [Crateriforma conspicua]|nr:hypothetical protein Mal65_34430 [Crateriforma conspicua]TWT69683.1 hypothetical protein Pan14r_19740 [Crateriforma conspicua]